MLHLLKRLLPARPLPSHVHYHHDERGNRFVCDESICRPTAAKLPLSIPPRW